MLKSQNANDDVGPPEEKENRLNHAPPRGQANQSKQLSMTSQSTLMKNNWSGDEEESAKVARSADTRCWCTFMRE
tara:strand:- start:80 stop:304 length:225 start_codon:yes stop_codon:yes gene_type:complete